MFAYILLLLCVGALALAKKRFLKLSLPLIRRDDPKPLKLHVANLALSADFDLFAKGLSSWTFNGSDVATLADRYKKSAGCVFVMGPTKVGKSFFINQLLGRDDAARSHEVHNTKGETYLIQERLDAPPIIIVDTEGFFQPIDERNPLITQDFVTEHCKYMANILVLVVNAMNTHDLALFQRIVRFFVTSPITNLYCIHNVRGINTEEALEKYIRDVKDYLRTDNDREPDRNMPSNFGRFGFVQPVDGLSAAARDREQQHRLNGAAARRVDRESNKAVFHLFMGNKKSLPDIVRQQVDHVKNTIRQPFVPRREFQDATQHAVKNLMLKYYAEREFNQADVIVEGTEVRLRKDLRLQPRQQFLQYNLVNLVNSDAYYGDPRPFSMKLGDGNSINLQESPIFIDCAGLDGKSLAVQFVDERTLQIVGKKTRYDQEPPRTMDVLEQLTLPWPLIGGELGVRRVMETRGNNEMGVAHFCVLLAA